MLAIAVCAGLLFLAMMFLAFGGMAEVPIAALAKKVVFKQHAASMYSIPSFVISTALVYIPLALLDTAVFGSILYWCVCLNPVGLLLYRGVP